MRNRLLLLFLPTGLLLPGVAAAGLYSPDEESLFEIDGQGFAKALPYNSFRFLLSEISALDVGTSRQRADVVRRIETRRAKGVQSLNAEELAGLSHDLIRLRRLDEAINLLQPITRSRGRAGFLVLTHLARTHQGRGEWVEAYEQQFSAVRDYEFPSTFGRLTKEQLTWLRRVERDYYLPFLRSRRDEVRQRRSGVQESVDPLFPPATPRGREPAEPAQFIGESGSFEPGAIAAAEKAKLPADAVAIVQQLILWNPDDTRLFWLLGELYNAQGDVSTALQIFDACVDAPRNYSNRQLMEHRTALREYVEAAARAERQRIEDEQSARRRQYYWVAGVGGLLVLVLGYFQVREWRRRLARRRSQVG